MKEEEIEGKSSTWIRTYAIVLGFLLVQILLYTWITQYFS